MDKGKKLERKLSSINVCSLALGCIIGWGAFVMPEEIFLGKAGPGGTAIAIGIAALIMIIIAFNYHYMINKFPITGGGFTYAKMAFGKKHAFICSWFLSISYLAIVPLNATALALIGRNLLDNIFQVGFNYSVAGYDIYLGEIILAVGALLLFAVLSIRGVKVAGVFQTILVFALVGGVLIISISAVVSGKLHIENLSPGFYPSNHKGLGIFAVVAVAPWAFVGFDTIPQAAEEFKFSPKKSKIIMILSILFGALVYIVLSTITASVFPSQYNNWVEYINDLPNLEGMLSLPTFHAASQLLGNTGLLFIGLAVLAAILSGVIGFYMAASRLFYSMAKENVLPLWFGKLHENYHTPANAILFIMAISMIAPFLGRNALGWIVDMSSIGAAIGYGYTSVAALKYAKKEQNILIEITGCIGIVMSIFFSILLLIPIPALDCSLSKEAYLCFAIWILLGIVFYFKRNKEMK